MVCQWPTAVLSQPAEEVNPTLPTYSSVPRRVAVWCALLLYGGASTPLGLGVAGLVGSFDRSHHLSVRGGGQGVQLILQHGRNCTGHHHSIVAKALAFFARPASAATPDHVIQFSAPDGLSRQAQMNAPTPASRAQPDFALVETSQPPPREDCLSSVPRGPPPDERGQLRCLRSTLLRI
jgi:hypothetical protein